MHKFTDKQDREWSVELNGYTTRKVREELGVLLTDLGDMRAGKESLAAKLFAEPYELLVQVLWVMCERQADERQVSPDDFAAGLWGDALRHASEALTATVADFFTNPAQGAALRSLLQKTMEAAEIQAERASKAIEAIDPVSLANSITASSLKPAESADSTPTSES